MRIRHSLRSHRSGWLGAGTGLAVDVLRTVTDTHPLIAALGYLQD